VTPDAPVVAIVHLARPGSFGAKARVAGLTEVFEGAGASVTQVRLLEDHRQSLSGALRPGLAAVLGGGTVPEAMSWNRRSVRAQLDSLRPDVVLCMTARAYHPALLRGRWHLVLDYVDCLSDSYRDRARIVGRRPVALAFSALAATSRRFERRTAPAGMSRIAAGWTDAKALGAEWIPITEGSAPAIADTAAEHDVLFLGKLSYPPNVEAIERLARVWPTLQRRRPGTTALLAGASPRPAIVQLANQLGWTVQADFDDVERVLASARLGVVPLVHASGIQTKILAAAARGLAQVVDPIACAGFAPGFPLQRAGDDDALVEAIARLLDDESERRQLGAAARVHVAETYSAPHWSPWARRLLEQVASNGHP
jgi:glycosyltransferase involved in cell wall biosynthesis